jgi:hypothetical protein
MDFESFGFGIRHLISASQIALPEINHSPSAPPENASYGISWLFLQVGDGQFRCGQFPRW